jgi:phosphate:Na+ symporter
MTQSTNAASYIVLGLVTTGFMPLGRAFLVVCWSAVGTAAIVLMATIRIELVVLYLVGITSFLQVSRFRDSPLWGPAISALFGVGTLFLGLQILRRSLGPMTDAPWFAEVIEFSHGAPVVLLALGAVMALVVQSSSTVAAAVVALSATGWLTFEALAALIYGSTVGSAAASLVIGCRMTGTGRQLLLFQAFSKVLGVAALLLLGGVEAALGRPSTVHAAIDLMADGLGAQTGIAFTLVQIVSALLATALRRPLAGLCRRLSPADAVESLSQPRFLYEEALEEPMTAVDLATREQARLAALLPQLLDPVRVDGPAEGQPTDTLTRGARGLGQAIDRFLNDILARRPHADAVGRTVALRSRNELLLSQLDTLVSLLASVRRLEAAAALRPFLEGMVESLHMIIETTAETLGSLDPEEVAMLRLMTGDRGDVVESMRQAAIRDHAGLQPAEQEELLRLTGLFERSIWIMGRLARTIDQGTAEEPVTVEAVA